MFGLLPLSTEDHSSRGPLLAVRGPQGVRAVLVAHEAIAVDPGESSSITPSIVAELTMFKKHQASSSAKTIVIVYYVRVGDVGVFHMFSHQDQPQLVDIMYSKLLEDPCIGGLSK